MTNIIIKLKECNGERIYRHHIIESYNPKEFSGATEYAESYAASFYPNSKLNIDVERNVDEPQYTDGEVIWEVESVTILSETQLAEAKYLLS